MIQRLRLSLPIVTVLGALLASPAWADSTIKVRLVSGGAGGEIDGTATLQGQSLHGHLIGNGADIELSGVVKNRTVTVNLVGRIAPICGMMRQSMSGAGDNEQENTSIEMSLECTGHAFGYGGGESYEYHLNLALPPHNLLPLGPSDAGENASLQ